MFNVYFLYLDYTIDYKDMSDLDVQCKINKVYFKRLLRCSNPFFLKKINFAAIGLGHKMVKNAFIAF